MQAERAGVPAINEDFSTARNVSMTPVQSAICEREIFRKVSERGNDISRRMRMIDAKRVARSIYRWLLSRLTALRAIARANTSTRADREQYRAVEILISNTTFHSSANERIKNFYERLCKLFERFNRTYTRRRQFANRRACLC